MTIRSLVFWPHLVAGVSAGLVILLMSVTGVLLTYERQMIAWSDRNFRSVPTSAGQAPLPIETLVARFREAHPDIAVASVTVAAEPDAPVELSASRRTLYVDAYTGALLGEGSQTMRGFMSALRAWHRWIAVEGDGRPVARAITGWSNFLFLFIVGSGVYLWFPRNWTWSSLRAVVWFRSGLRGKARDFNWHNVIGFWSAVPLFIVVLTAMPISFPWFSDLVYRSVGEAPPTPGGGGAARGGGREPVTQASGVDRLLARAMRQEAGWRTITMWLPASSDEPVVFAIDRGDGGQPQLRSTLTLDPAVGRVLSYETFSSLSPGRRARTVMRFAHTGEVLGIPGQTVAGLVSAGGAVLVWTGLALAWRRFRAWSRRRAERTAAHPVLHRPSTSVTSESHP